VIPYSNGEWEKLSIVLNLLIPKLPAPKEEDLSKGVLESIDMDSYRAEKKTAIRIQLPDQEGEIEPVPTDARGGRGEPELDRLSSILKSFNDQFGNIKWTDNDRIRRFLTEEIPSKVSADKAYQNAKKNSDKQNARIEHDKALGNVIIGLMKDDTELFKQFSDNPSFKKWVADTIFSSTYNAGG
jgi:type I restriction enzyme R subunit